jgi:hypothetical protein
MLRISFSNLPPRPRALSHGELSRIFGGCGSEGATCSDKGCCPGYVCTASGRCIGQTVGTALDME